MAMVRPSATGRVGEAEHQPTEGEILHPGAGQRDELAEPEEPVVAVAQRAEGVEKAAHRAGSPGSLAPRARRARPEPGHLVAVEVGQHVGSAAAEGLHTLPLLQHLADVGHLDARRGQRLGERLRLAGGAR